MRLLTKLDSSVILTGGFVHLVAGGNWHCKFFKLLILILYFRAGQQFPAFSPENFEGGRFILIKASPIQRDSDGSQLFDGVHVMLSLIKDSALGLVAHFVPGAVQHPHAMVALEPVFVPCHEMPVQGV